MTTLIVSDSNFVDPQNLIPYLEKDEAITRGVTLGLIDFSNSSSYSGVGAIAAGSKLNSLTSDATQGSFVTAFDAVANGLLPFSKGVGAAQVALPATMKFAAAASKVLYILWAKIPAGGWNIPASNPVWGLFGVYGNTGTLAQFGVDAAVSLSDGSLIKIDFYVPSSGSASSGNLTVTAGSLMSSIADGNLHQLALLWDAKSTAGQQTTSLYVDQALVAQSGPRAYDGTFNIPATAPALGYPGTAFQNTTAPHAGLKLGRPGLWNLSNSQANPTDIIAADFSAAQGYLS
ncbi:TPA: hypothetical protein QDB14_001019 [Burkholderia vietnamiensis]|nr:hypothetical protein [Burkholderia vietnamiensis]